MKKVKSYHKLVNLSQAITGPPVTKEMSREELENIRELPYEVEHPDHNQSVERYIKVITDASSRVVAKEKKRDGIIRLN